MYEAIKDSAADEFDLTIRADGKVSFGAVEIIELEEVRVQPLVTPPARDRYRRRLGAPA